MRKNWSSGYVADLTYSHGYYHELSPPFIRFFLLMNGYASAVPEGGYRYCELGYGQGVSCNLHAAANPRGRFWGTDFYPDHALFAQDLAAQAGLQADWMALSFEQLLEAELPQFDFITLHGVWSWIHAPARHAIVEFMRRHLKVGGVAYLSYNIMPGWSAEKPLRDLLWLHTELAGAAGASTASRIRGALDFAERLRRGKAGFFEQNAKASQMLDDMLRDDVAVVAHEYFNRSWHICYFPDLAEALEPAGLSFACSLHRSDLLGEVFQRNQALALGELAPTLRQATNDFLLNRRFRRDVFLRGGNKLPAARREEQLRQVGLVLARPAGSISAMQQTPYGSVTLDATLTRRLARAMEAAPGCITIGELIEQADLHSSPSERVYETIAALVAQSVLAPVFPDDAKQAGQSRARAMNLAIAQRACHDNLLRYLASPVTGQALEAGRTERLFLLAWEQGARSPAQLCDAAWPLQRSLGTGDTDDAQDGARREFAAQSEQFVQDVAPLWRRLGILQEGAP